MQLRPIANNQNEINTSEVSVLFSYETPVAYLDLETDQCFRTDRNWSQTTTKHINKWLDGRTAALIAQEALDHLL